MTTDFNIRGVGVTDVADTALGDDVTNLYLAWSSGDEGWVRMLPSELRDLAANAALRQPGAGAPTSGDAISGRPQIYLQSTPTDNALWYHDGNTANSWTQVTSSLRLSTATPVVAGTAAAGTTDGTVGASAADHVHPSQTIADGASIGVVFQRAASAPATPAANSGTSASGQLTAAPTGWVLSSAIGTLTGSNPIYASVVTISTSGTRTYGAPIQFTGPSAVDGVALAVIYRRSATAITAAPTGGTADYPSLTPPTGWTLAVPIGTNTLYGAVASITAASVSYSLPIQLDGRDGMDGSDGIAMDAVYTRSATVPGTPAANAGASTYPSVTTAPTNWVLASGINGLSGNDPLYISFVRVTRTSRMYTVPIRLTGVDGLRGLQGPSGGTPQLSELGTFTTAVDFLSGDNSLLATGITLDSDAVADNELLLINHHTGTQASVYEFILSGAEFRNITSSTAGTNATASNSVTPWGRSFVLPEDVTNREAIGRTSDDELLYAGNSVGNGDTIVAYKYSASAGGDSSGTALAVSEEGTEITASAASMNFVGTGVTATASGNDVTVTFTGGGGTGTLDSVGPTNLDGVTTASAGSLIGVSSTDDTMFTQVDPATLDPYTNQEVADKLTGDTGGDVNFTTQGTGANASLRGAIRDGVVDTDALANNAVTNDKVADNAVGLAELSASGTPSSANYLRGDNTWATPPSGGITTVNTTDLDGITTATAGRLIAIDGTTTSDFQQIDPATLDPYTTAEARTKLQLPTPAASNDGQILEWNNTAAAYRFTTKPGASTLASPAPVALAFEDTTIPDDGTGTAAGIAANTDPTGNTDVITEVDDTNDSFTVRAGSYLVELRSHAADTSDQRYEPAWALHTASTLDITTTTPVAFLAHEYIRGDDGSRPSSVVGALYLAADTELWLFGYQFEADATPQQTGEEGTSEDIELWLYPMGGITGAAGADGTPWSVGGAFPASPANNQFHLFNADASSLTGYVDAALTARTAATNGEYAQYDADNTRWIQRGTLRGPTGAGTQGAEGPGWSAGSSFPDSPVDGALHLFTASVSSLTDYVDSSATALTTAEAGDYACYNSGNTRWEYKGTLAGPFQAVPEYVTFNPTLTNIAANIVDDQETGRALVYSMNGATGEVALTRADGTDINAGGAILSGRDSSVTAGDLVRFTAARGAYMVSVELLIDGRGNDRSYPQMALVKTSAITATSAPYTYNASIGTAGTAFESGDVVMRSTPVYLPNSTDAWYNLTGLMYLAEDAELAPVFYQGERAASGTTRAGEEYGVEGFRILFTPVGGFRGVQGPPGVVNLSDTAAVAIGDTAAAGVSAGAARQDHVHPNTGLLGLSDTDPVALGATAAEGTATDASRQDHVHPTTGLLALSDTDPVALAAAAAEGTATDASRQDHVHPTTGLSVSTHTHTQDPALSDTDPVALADAAAEGTATEASRQDHIHPNTGLAAATHSHNFTVPLSDTDPVALAAAAAEGTATLASRQDHVHPTTGLSITSHTHTQDPALSDTDPVALAAAAAEGTATEASRQDHVHPTTGLALLANVPSASDTAPGNTPGTPAAGSSTDYSRSDHDHGITPGTGGEGSGPGNLTFTQVGTTTSIGTGDATSDVSIDDITDPILILFEYTRTTANLTMSGIVFKSMIEATGGFRFQFQGSGPAHVVIDTDASDNIRFTGTGNVDAIGDVEATIYNMEASRGRDGTPWTVGTAFPADPVDGALHLFNADASGLTDYVDSSDTALTTAAAGYYASYDADNTRWVQQGALVGAQGPRGVTTAGGPENFLEMIGENDDGFQTGAADPNSDPPTIPSGTFIGTGITFPATVETDEIWAVRVTVGNNNPGGSLSFFTAQELIDLTASTSGTSTPVSARIPLLEPTGISIFLGRTTARELLMAGSSNNTTYTDISLFRVLGGIRGTPWTVGDAFPASPIGGALHLFNAAASSLTGYVDSDGSAVTAAAAGDYAQYDMDNTRWVQQGSLQGGNGLNGTDGATWTVGDDFPASPSNGDLHLFDEDGITTGTYTDTDGTARSNFRAGDYAAYVTANTRWEFQGSLAGPVGPTGPAAPGTLGLVAVGDELSLADSVARVGPLMSQLDSVLLLYLTYERDTGVTVEMSGIVFKSQIETGFNFHLQGTAGAYLVIVSSGTSTATANITQRTTGVANATAQFYNITSGQQGVGWTAGTSLPANPADGQLHLFTGDASSLSDYVDTDGSTAITTAVSGDYARYSLADTEWVKQGTLRGSDGSGQGVPSGGTAGQILSKIDGTDYNTQWVDNSGGGGGLSSVATTDLDGVSTATAGRIIAVDGTDTTNFQQIDPATLDPYTTAELITKLGLAAMANGNRQRLIRRTNDNTGGFEYIDPATLDPYTTAELVTKLGAAAMANANRQFLLRRKNDNTGFEYVNPSTLDPYTIAEVVTKLGLAAMASGNRNYIVRRKNDETGFEYVDPATLDPYTAAEIRTKIGLPTPAAGNDGQILEWDNNNSRYNLVAKPTGGGGGSAISVSDEGTALTAALASMNFVGSGVEVTEGTEGVLTITITGTSGTNPGSHARHVGWSAGTSPSGTEVSNGASFTGDVLTIPATSTNGYLWFAVDADATNPTQAFFDGNSHDVFAAFVQRSDTFINGNGVHVWSTSVAQSAAILGTGSRTITLRYG